MYSSGVALRLIFATSFVAMIFHCGVARLQLNRNLIYSKVGDIMVIPYVLQLRDQNGSFLCAGTLIAPQYVITAASCFDRIDFTTIVAVAGATELTEEGVQRGIAKINKHQAKHINVAVLKLNATLDAFDTVPLAATSVDELPDDTRVLLTGWRHLTRRKSVSKEMYFDKNNIGSQGECEMKFYAAGTKKLFCLAGDGYDNHFCCADIGGPALFNGTLIGIVSKGFNCGDPEYLIAATSVFDVLPFIKEAMK